jgi:hypothetical protein
MGQKGEAMASKTVDVAAPKPQGSARARLFAWKTFSATFGGAVLTGIVALTQTWYGNHLEVLRRQSDGGAEYQAQLFELMGAAENGLRQVLTAIRRDDVEAAANLMSGPVGSALDTWSNRVYLIRNRGAEIYGRGAGAFVFDAAERGFRLDGCNVLVRGAGPGGGDCSARQREELAFVNRFRDVVMHGSDLRPFRTVRRSPVSYHAHLTITAALAERYILCARTRASPRRPAQIPPRCQDLAGLRELLNSRFDLLRTARLNVATAIMDRSTLRD